MGRLHLAQSRCDHEQPVGILAHEPQAMDKHRTPSCKGVDKVGQVFPLHYATIFHPHDGIVSEFQGSGLDPSKPSLKARKVERILLAGVNDEHRAKSLTATSRTTRRR